MKRNEWRFLPGHLRHRRATFFGAMIFLLGLFSVLGTGCQDAMDEEETRVLRQATEHDPHYDFQEDYEPGYCGSFTALGDGPQQVASIDSHGQLFTPERRRPSWSDISEGRHYLDSESTVGYDAEGERIIEPNTAQRIPDYRMVSNNFKLLNSLTLLLSSLTKVTDTINDIDENGFGDLVAEFANDSICQAYGNEVGHCICTTPGSQLPCGGNGGFSDGADLLDSVGDAFNGLPAAAGQAFETVAQDFINFTLKRNA